MKRHVLGATFALAGIAGLAAGVHELSSSAIAFDTKVRTVESTAQTTPFDSCDRRSRTAPAIAFRSTPPTGNVLLVR